jgi:hypothetical protein
MALKMVYEGKEFDYSSKLFEDGPEDVHTYKLAEDGKELKSAKVYSFHIWKPTPSTRIYLEKRAAVTVIRFCNMFDKKIESGPTQEFLRVDGKLVQIHIFGPSK